MSHADQNLPHVTTIVTTNAALREMHLSYYSLSKLSHVLHGGDPVLNLEHRLSHPAFAHYGWTGALTLDSLGNFVSFA